MSLQELHERYLWIAKNSLQFLTQDGFQKKGTKYFKQKEGLVLKIYSLVPRPWLNSEHSYEFDICWDIKSDNHNLIQLFIFMGAKKSLKEAFLMGSNIILEKLQGHWNLTDQDPPYFDQNYVDGLKEEIKALVLPLFDNINSIDDVITLAEEEAKLKREQRKLFPYGVYGKLALLYAYKGWKEKTLEMCDQDIEETPITARDLAEKDKLKYIKYFEQIKKFE